MLTIKTGAHNETWSALISWGVCNTSASTKQGTCTSRPRAVTQKSPISCMKLSEARWQMSIICFTHFVCTSPTLQILP